uniref:hypothetical protein n=1 Tax=Candidatus Electronema sp. TaxID=2698783 RepID=UPI0040566770
MSFCDERQETDGVNNPCPAGFRLPTADEWQEEIDSWTNKDNSGAFASILKLPMPICRAPYSGGTVWFQGEYGYYWSSTTKDTFAKNLLLGDDFIGNPYINSYRRAAGYSVRCIKD